jgi:hypothetical protein
MKQLLMPKEANGSSDLVDSDWHPFALNGAWRVSAFKAAVEYFNALFGLWRGFKPMVDRLNRYRFTE